MQVMTPISSSRFVVEYRRHNGEVAKRYFATKADADAFVNEVRMNKTYNKKGWKAPTVKAQW